MILVEYSTNSKAIYVSSYYYMLLPILLQVILVEYNPCYANSKAQEGACDERPQVLTKTY